MKLVKENLFNRLERSLKSNAIKEIEKIKTQPQAQYDLNLQLEILISAANRLGLYDAADYLRKVMEK
jgi:hypothetical protein